VHSQQASAGHRGEWAGARKTARGQPGLRFDARRGPAVVGPRLDHHVPAIRKPQAEHHRDLPGLEQHADWFSGQLVPAPGRQPVRQLLERCGDGHADVLRFLTDAQ
jgi:hypothetical protein